MTSEAWRRWREGVDLDDYDTRWERMAAAGEAVHGEADFVASLGPASVLDAGCGTGRVGLELARRGIEVVGVDADPDMLERARRRSADVTWVLADLAAFDLGRTFDVVVLAGNVLPFVDPGSRAAAVAACARHLGADGRLVAGAGLRAGWPSVDDLDGWAAVAGLGLEQRFAGWGREPWTAASDYAVTIHRLRPVPPVTPRRPTAGRAAGDR
jgi:SAM-dependent methyltransferase